MRFVLDIESSDLLQNGLDYTTMPYRLKEDYSLWCIVVRNIDTNEVISLSESECTRANLKAALKGATELIGHNLVAFDAPVLKLLNILDYEIGYPGEPSTLYGEPCTFTDTLLWSKLLNADRLGGHSLKAWGKRLGDHKGDYSDWSRFTPEMLDYCIQDTAVNARMHFELLKEAGTWDFSRAYSMEVKLQDLTLKQELFGFEFNSDLAHNCLVELKGLLESIAAKVDPILPEKQLTKTALKEYTAPALQFKKDGSLSSHMQKFIEKHNLQYSTENREVIFNDTVLKLPLTLPLKSTVKATTEDIEVVKGYLLDMGWVPSEVKERDLVKKADKTTRNKEELVDTIKRYVQQTENSLFKELRCDLLDVSFDKLENFLLNKIDGVKPIYVPTSPKLTVGVEKEICPSLVKLGKKAEFANEVVKYYTYRHRRNSIAGGTWEDEEEAETGFLSYVREDGRVPTPADILGANTGRYRHKIVCNIPRVTSLYGDKMRALFGAGKGLYQLGFDFASLEARVMGHFVIGPDNCKYTDGAALAEALVASKPNDIHSINARKLGIDRTAAKSFSYAAIYGAQPKKLSKMLGITEAKGKQLFNEYWEAVPALKELKTNLENYWKGTGNKYIMGLDGRRLVTRSKHSLINVLFQSGGAVVAKWSTVRISQHMEKQGLLGNPFEHTDKELKIWMMTAQHDEVQYAVHPKLMNIKNFVSDEEAQANMQDGCSAVGHGSRGVYLGYKTPVVDCIDSGIKEACKELQTRTQMGFEWIPGSNWAQCH